MTLLSIFKLLILSLVANGIGEYDGIYDNYYN